MVVSAREKVIGELLGLYRDLADPMQSGNGGTEGLGGLSMPITYSPSVRELERLLKSMREDRHASLVETTAGKVSLRKLHWHVSERFIRCTTKNAWQTVPAKTRSGKKTTRRVRQIVTVVDPGVSEVLVAAGIRWLATAWSLTHEPFLPKLVVESRGQVAGVELEEAA